MVASRQKLEVKDRDSRVEHFMLSRIMSMYSCGRSCRFQRGGEAARFALVRDLAIVDNASIPGVQMHCLAVQYCDGK